MSTSTQRKSTKTSIVSGGRNKVHTTFEDGEEMVEEFDVNTDELLVRRRRLASTLGAKNDWVYEIGLAPPIATTAAVAIVESSSNPQFSRKDTDTEFQFRIRNLPYSVDVYNISVDDNTQEIVVRTANKKYFKRIGISDMKSAGLKLDASAVTYTHTNNTLIVSYAKPAEILALEAAARRERTSSAMQVDETSKSKKDGDVDCKQQ